MNPVSKMRSGTNPAIDLGCPVVAPKDSREVARSCQVMNQEDFWGLIKEAPIGIFHSSPEGRFLSANTYRR